MRLLLVDDDESNRLTLAVLLEDEGYEVDVAASFAEARAKIVAPGAAYDGVLLDQHLGDGLGLDLLGAVRRHLPGAKAVLISGSISELEGSSCGADGVLPKAMPFPEALAVIRRALGEPASV
ncbi:MAG TPA: response regulator [Polyangiaceae bacterium]|nr:response regulator [Polyangiaceae bacterium]